MYRQVIAQLIEMCTNARRAGIATDEIRARLLPEALDSLLGEINPKDFLEWVKEDREYCFYYFDAQQQGVCAKPAEAAAMILESIAVDAFE